MIPAPFVVIGQGNEYRGDDGAGPEVVRRLRVLNPRVRNRVEFASGPLDMAEIIELWDGTRHTIFVDAVVSKKPPGTIFFFNPLSSPVPVPEEFAFPTSTHDAPSITQTLKLGQALGRLPEELGLYCIEGRDFSYKIGLTPAVEEAVGRLVAEISKVLRRLLYGPKFPDFS